MVQQSTSAGSGQLDDREALLRAVAEELKRPLIYIARQAELGRHQEAISVETLVQVQANADAATRLVDSYMLGLDLAQQRLELELEPVSLSSVLYDVAHDITPLFKQHGGSVALKFGGRYGQVMAHRAGLSAALSCLGGVLSTLLDSGDTEGETTPQLVVAAHRSPQGGIITGLYVSGLHGSLGLMNGQRLLGSAAQPFTKTLYSGGAGVFVAQQLFDSMGSRLRDGRFRGDYGLAATLQQSQQLRLV